MEHRDERLTKDQLYSAWCSLNDDNKQTFVALAVNQKKRASTLLVDIADILTKQKEDLRGNRSQVLYVEPVFPISVTCPLLNML